jgi:hypothetical protein
LVVAKKLWSGDEKKTRTQGGVERRPCIVEKKGLGQGQLDPSLHPPWRGVVGEGKGELKGG